MTCRERNSSTNCVGCLEWNSDIHIPTHHSCAPTVSTVLQQHNKDRHQNLFRSSMVVSIGQIIQSFAREEGQARSTVNQNDQWFSREKNE